MKYSWNIIEICYFCREENSVSEILVLSFKCALGILVGVLLSAIPAPVSPVSLSFLFPLLDSCVPNTETEQSFSHKNALRCFGPRRKEPEKRGGRDRHGTRQRGDGRGEVFPVPFVRCISVRAMSWYVALRCVVSVCLQCIIPYFHPVSLLCSQLFLP